MYEVMPSKFRMRSSAKPFKYKGNVAKSVAALKKRGLNKTEKKETRAIAKRVIQTRKETKFCPTVYTYDDFTNPTALDLPALGVGVNTAPVLSNIYNGTNQACTLIGLQGGYYFNETSNDLVNQFPNAVLPLGGLGMERGDTSTTMDGNYAYMQSRKLSLQINATPSREVDANKLPIYQAPLTFRLLHVTMKHNANVEPSLLRGLFVDHTGTKTGFASDGTVKDILYDWQINREQWTVHKDIKFKLQQIVAGAQAVLQNSAPVQDTRVYQAVGQNTPAYPQQKNISLWLTNTKKKLRFNTINNGTDNNFEMLNFNGQDYIFLITCRETVPNNLVGQQVADQVSVRAQMCAKYRDA
ncbi:MAG: putative capsid protein [Cressdnaviricota sp.]|nr:MAG: putative capsid protein [Cressdnaviricota sp.]